MTPQARLRDALTQMYGPETARDLFQALTARARTWEPQLAPWAAQGEPGFSPHDLFLIAYGDHILPEDPQAPKLQGLRAFLETFVGRLVRGVHVLPFFPYSSDDGFAVMDYTQVRPDLGTWADIRDLARQYVLMVDLVLNHVSSRHPWFRAFLKGDPAYRDFFITVEDPHDPAWQGVMRPRATALFTPFISSRGRVYVWTTFSPDQVDLNYHNPRVFLAMTDVLMFYVSQGAQVIRLDAVAYVWKEPYTSCIHLPQAHALVRAWRALLDWLAPWVRLITETNVPHEENISYFGHGDDEAHMVYNFTLPPLTLHAFLREDARTLTRWARTLHTPSETTAFFNFLASHDGIGMLPAKGWLSEAERAYLVETTLEHHGQVSYKALPGGRREVYELNITWYDALNHPDRPTPWDVDRFVASYAVALSLEGVPALYLPVLFGARNCLACLEKYGYPRAINREKYPWPQVQAWLKGETREARVFQAMTRLLEVRRTTPAFHPAGRQTLLDLHPKVLAVLREHQGQRVLALVSMSSQPQTLSYPQDLGSTPWQDLLSETHWVPGVPLTLRPYQVAWLQPA